MLINTAELLDWDSKFFGYSVARVVLDKYGCENLDELFEQIKSEKIKLTYFFVPSYETKLNDLIAKRGLKLIDQKTTYAKETGKQSNYSNEIIEFQGEAVKDKLIELGLQAGLFSRFRLDKNFSNNEYERLYGEWLIKSLNKELALKSFIAKEGSDITGITTLGKKTEFAEIGLVAVDSKFRGKGIGYDLIHYADNVAFELGFKEIKVATQLRNAAACSLYEKCNFKIESIINVYHYWQ
jgi:dTDP-4-amino-4,6-dideoxy-D-galactose acyltransferase